MHSQRQESFEEKETGRVEAFSDGVFAIAITLLVLNIKVPALVELSKNFSLGIALLEQWHSYLAFFIGFINILIMWVNHHYIFSYIRKTDSIFLFLNGFLLLTVTFFPFSTALLSEHIRTDHSAISAAIFAGSIFMNCLSFVLLWAYVSGPGGLLKKNTGSSVIKSIRRNGLIGLPLYIAAIILAFVNVWSSIAVCFMLGLFFSITASFKK